MLTMPSPGKVQKKDAQDDNDREKKIHAAQAQVEDLAEGEDDRKMPPREDVSVEDSSGAPERKRKATAPLLMKKTKKHQKDMPRRPRSAYNFFFRDERVKIVAAREQRDREAKAAEAVRQYLEGSSSTAAGQDPEGDEEMGLFAELGKTVSKRWKQISPERHRHYQRMAEADLIRYRADMVEYNRRTAQRQTGETKAEPTPGSPSSARLPVAPPRSETRGAAGGFAAQALAAGRVDSSPRSPQLTFDPGSFGSATSASALLSGALAGHPSGPLSPNRAELMSARRAFGSEPTPTSVSREAHGFTGTPSSLSELTPQIQAQAATAAALSRGAPSNVSSLTAASESAPAPGRFGHNLSSAPFSQPDLVSLEPGSRLNNQQLLEAILRLHEAQQPRATSSALHQTSGGSELLSLLLNFGSGGTTRANLPNTQSQHQLSAPRQSFAAGTDVLPPQQLSAQPLQSSRSPGQAPSSAASSAQARLLQQLASLTQNPPVPQQQIRLQASEQQPSSRVQPASPSQAAAPVVPQETSTSTSTEHNNVQLADLLLRLYGTASLSPLANNNQDLTNLLSQNQDSASAAASGDTTTETSLVDLLRRILQHRSSRR